MLYSLLIAIMAALAHTVEWPIEECYHIAIVPLGVVTDSGFHYHATVRT